MKKRIYIVSFQSYYSSDNSLKNVYSEVHYFSTLKEARDYANEHAKRLEQRFEFNRFSKRYVGIDYQCATIEGFNVNVNSKDVTIDKLIDALDYCDPDPDFYQVIKGKRKRYIH